MAGTANEDASWALDVPGGNDKCPSSSDLFQMRATLLKAMFIEVLDTSTCKWLKQSVAVSATTFVFLVNHKLDNVAVDMIAKERCPNTNEYKSWRSSRNHGGLIFHLVSKNNENVSARRPVQSSTSTKFLIFSSNEHACMAGSCLLPRPTFDHITSAAPRPVQSQACSKLTRLPVQVVGVATSLSNVINSPISVGKTAWVIALTF